MISAKKLIKMAKKWQLKRNSFPRNTNHDSSDTFDPSTVVEKGYFVVYTVDQKRFMVPLAYLKNSVIRELLKMSEEEYGLPSDGPIILPCDSIFMDYVICLIRQGRTEELHESLDRSS